MALICNKFLEHDQDVSCLYYWGDKTILLSSSWDRLVRLSDDSTSKPEGDKRYDMDKHRQAVNFIDFKPEQTLCASASDDNSVIIYNYGSNRQEGHLDGHELEVKICKFLNPYNILASADLDGRIYFWGVMPSAAKNELLCTVKDDIESEVGTIENFPIRGMDFDSENMILYTGDEMGYMHKWDLSRLINKLTELDRKVEESKGYNISELVHEFMGSLKQFEVTRGALLAQHAKGEKKDKRPKKTAFKMDDDSNTFMTEAMLKGNQDLDPDDRDELPESEKDVILLNRWKAHSDGITWVTYNNDPPFIASSSFDKNVYIWNEECKRIGSLVLGHYKFWNIKIDKTERMDREKKEAEEMLEKAEGEDNDSYDKERNAREMNLKVMKQIRMSKQRREMKYKKEFDDMI